MGESANWLNTSSLHHMVIGGADAASFQGSVSCLQFFKEGLSPQEIHHYKKCPSVVEWKSTPCPNGHYYYDGMCYQVSLPFSRLIYLVKQK